MITFEWSWFSFFMGAAALFTLMFWVTVAVAVRQGLKQRSKASAFEELVKDWDKKNSPKK